MHNELRKAQLAAKAKLASNLALWWAIKALDYKPGSPLLSLAEKKKQEKMNEANYYRKQLQSI